MQYLLLIGLAPQCWCKRPVLWNRERKEHNALRRGAEVIVCCLTCVIHKWTVHSILLWDTQIVCCTVENAQRIATGC